MAKNTHHYSWNRNLGRDVAYETADVFVRPKYNDVKTIRMAPFIESVVRQQFDSSKGRNPAAKIAAEDLVLDTFLTKVDMTPLLGKVFASQEAYYRKLIHESEQLLKSKSRDDILSGKVLISWSNANLKELAKRQILVGSQLLHHNLSFGDHFVHAEIPPYFESIDWRWVDQAGKWFRQFTKMERKTKFTVPIGTSQGLILKSKADGPMWRTVSKGIQAALALKAKDYAQFKSGNDAIDGLFKEYGYDSVCNSYFLGLRRQHSIKEEVIDDVLLSSPAYEERLDCSKGLQGRARGIFPPAEYSKVYYKKFSEGLKQSLFQYTDICNVNQSIISSKLHYIQHKTMAKGLFDERSGKLDGWLTFYDLSAYDTCTHAGCGRIYDNFLRSSFDNWDKIEGDHFKDFSIIFPLGVNSRSIICKQDVKNRSTQSGQPDVTVKNNVVHLLLLSHSISYALNKERKGNNIKPFDVFKQLVSGIGSIKDLTALMHGDDAAVYFSDSQASYVEFYDEMTRLGIKTSSEQYSIYLKKTPDLKLSAPELGDRVITLCERFMSRFRADINKHHNIKEDLDYSKSFSVQLEALIGSSNIMDNTVIARTVKSVLSDQAKVMREDGVMSMLSDVFTGTFEEYDKVLNDLVKASVSPKTYRYVKGYDPLCVMRGVPGSLARNRFGEYGVKDSILGLLSLYDTWPMLPFGTPASQQLQWIILHVAVMMSDKGQKRFYHAFSDAAESLVVKEAVPQDAKKCLTHLHDAYSSLNDSRSHGRLPAIQIQNLIRGFDDASMKDSLLSTVTYITITAQTKAKNLRGYLDRLYYSSGEQFLDADLEQIYGSIQYDPADMSTRLGLATKSFDEILNICLKYQKEIFDSGGLAPTVFDDITTDNLRDILKFQ